MLFSSSLGEKFHLSAPIVWAVSPWGQVVSVSFYLGRGPQAMPNHNASHWPPPRPGHPAVRLECWPPMKVFARYHAYHQAIQLVCFLFLFRVRPLYEKSPFYLGTRLWNSLDKETQESDSIYSFKRKIQGIYKKYNPLV